MSWPWTGYEERRINKINKNKDCCDKTQPADTDVFPVVASLHPTFWEERCVTTLKTAV